MLLHRLSVTSISGELVRHDLESAEESIIEAPGTAELIASTARADRTGGRIVHIYRAADATDQRNVALGLWQDGTSRPFAGDASEGIIAFALAPDGTVAYLALPLEPEDAIPALFVTHLDGGDVRSIGTLPTDVVLAANPASTSIAISDDGSRVSVSVPERTEIMSPVRYLSFGIDVDSGDAVENTVENAGGENGVAASSISPDGSTVVLFDVAQRQLIAVDFGDPGSARAVGPRLGVGIDRPVAWSRGGSHVAYGDLAAEGGYQAFARPVHGGDPTQLTSFEEGLWNSSLSWSE